MRKIGFVVDSTLGVSKEVAKEIGITVVSLKVLIDEDSYIDGEFDYNYVIQGLADKKIIRTSQPAPYQFIDAVNSEFAKGYEDVVILTLSKQLSGTYNSANLAKLTMQNDHVHVLDTQTTIQGGEYILSEALTLANEGKDIKDVLENIENNINNGSLFFTVDNLSVLVRNGRLSKMSSLIGNVLHIKPILRFKLGELTVEHKSRGFQKVLDYIVNNVKKTAENFILNIRIGYVDQMEKANELLEILKQEVKDATVKLMGAISPVIAAHVGLGGLGIYVNAQPKA